MLFFKYSILISIRVFAVLFQILYTDKSKSICGAFFQILYTDKYKSICSALFKNSILISLRIFAVLCSNTLY